VFSALEVCYENALYNIYKFTFDIDIDIDKGAGIPGWLWRL